MYLIPGCPSTAATVIAGSLRILIKNKTYIMLNGMYKNTVTIYQEKNIEILLNVPEAKFLRGSTVVSL